MTRRTLYAVQGVTGEEGQDTWVFCAYDSDVYAAAIAKMLNDELERHIEGAKKLGLTNSISEWVCRHMKQIDPGFEWAIFPPEYRVISVPYEPGN